MHIQNRLAAFIFRTVLTAACFTGLFLDLGLAHGKLRPGMLDYYTIQSNILVLVTFVIVTVNTLRGLIHDGIKGTTVTFPHFKGAVTMAITVTFLIYAFLLEPRNFTMNGDKLVITPENLLVHYITPSLVILDWLLFDKKGMFRWFDPLLWLIIPYIYMVFAFVRAQVAGIIPGTASRYPYFFIDIDKYGWKVAGYVAGLTLFFTVLGYIIFAVDKIGSGHFFRRRGKTKAE